MVHLSTILGSLFNYFIVSICVTSMKELHQAQQAILKFDELPKQLKLSLSEQIQ